MGTTRCIRWVAVCLATLGLCLPQVAMAAKPQDQTATAVSDVRLHESGALLGQVVTPENRPVAGAKITLHSAGKELAVARSDKSGYFAFNGLSNGVYQLSSPKGQGTYRVWTHKAAPPAAHLGALVVDSDQVVRGQNSMRGFRNLMANPWFVAAVIAGAIAIPVATHNSKSAKASTL